eukprot:4743422-Pyramimonas_sp.AAC.1
MFWIRAPSATISGTTLPRPWPLANNTWPALQGTCWIRAPHATNPYALCGDRGVPRATTPDK